MKMFDIVGLAGCLKPVIKTPALWHLMSSRENHRGGVYHPVAIDDVTQPVRYSSFGFTPARVTIIDGLFIAINLKVALNKKWSFNENYAYHHYDIASCIDANMKQMKIGVAPIHAIHQSAGLSSTNDTRWRESEAKFLAQYAVK